MEKVAILLTYVNVCGAVKEKMVFVLRVESTEPDMHTRQTLSSLLQCSLCLPKRHVSTCRPWQPHLNLLINLLWG